MKRIIAVLLSLFLFAPACATTPAPLDQKARLDKDLTHYEQMFQLEEHWIDLSVKHKDQMHDRGVWGDMYVDDNGAHIEVMDQSDMPSNYSASYRAEFQKRILEHEVMHVFMVVKGVPDEWQDGLIHLFQPLLKK